MKRKITQIQFLDHQVNLEFNHEQRFQFCDRCDCEGGHLQEFLAAFAPEVNLSKLTKRSVIFLERQLFYALTHYLPRRATLREIYLFMEKLHKRLDQLNSKE